jgi:hypothetical protein
LFTDFSALGLHLIEHGQRVNDMARAVRDSEGA